MAITPGTAGPTIHRILADEADPTTRLITASTARLGERIGSTRRGAGRAIDRLVAAGHLEIVRRGAGAGHAAVYRVITAPQELHGVARLAEAGA